MPMCFFFFLLHFCEINNGEMVHGEKVMLLIV